MSFDLKRGILRENNYVFYSLLILVFLFSYLFLLNYTEISIVWKFWAPLLVILIFSLSTVLPFILFDNLSKRLGCFFIIFIIFYFSSFFGNSTNFIHGGNESFAAYIVWLIEFIVLTIPFVILHFLFKWINNLEKRSIKLIIFLIIILFIIIVLSLFGGKFYRIAHDKIMFESGNCFKMKYLPGDVPYCFRPIFLKNKDPAYCDSFKDSCLAKLCHNFLIDSKTIIFCYPRETYGDIDNYD